MRDAHDPMQNFVNALCEHDKGHYLPVFLTTCEEYGFKGLCGKDCPAYGSKEECKHGEKFDEAWNLPAETKDNSIILDELIPRCTPKAAELLKSGLLGAIKVCAVNECIHVKKRK